MIDAPSSVITASASLPSTIAWQGIRVSVDRVPLAGSAVARTRGPRLISTAGVTPPAEAIADETVPARLRPNSLVLAGVVERKAMRQERMSGARGPTSAGQVLDDPVARDARAPQRRGVLVGDHAVAVGPGGSDRGGSDRERRGHRRDDARDRVNDGPRRVLDHQVGGVA